MQKTDFKENVILIDADYVDSVAYHLWSNFEKMLGRTIKDADLATWLVCCALDGGVPEGKNEVQCVFLHGEEKLMLEQFYPAHLKSEIDGTAFMDVHLGEFLMSAIPTDEAAGGDLFAQCAEVLLDSKQVKRLILVPEWDACDKKLESLLTQIPEGKKVTLLTMQPHEESACHQVMLGYSLMHAMGIKGDEL